MFNNKSIIGVIFSHSPRISIIISALLISLFTTACSEKKEKLAGLRESVLIINGDIKIDDTLAKEKITFTKVIKNDAWPKIDGDDFVNKSGTYEYKGKGNILWEKNISQSRFAFLNNDNYMVQPVASDGMIFTLNNEGTINAIDADNGTSKWKQSIMRPNHSVELIGGGLAIHNNYLYVSSPLAEVICIDIDDGKIIWRTETYSPIRSTPAVSQGKVVVNSIDGTTVALDTESGALLWKHTATAESTIVFGGSTPTIKGDTVIIAYASGEIFTLNLQSGQPLWKGLVEASNSIIKAAAVNHVRSKPLIKDNILIVMGYSDITKAYDVNSGEELWELPVGGHQVMPTYGEYVFAITNENMLLCFRAKDGKIKWTKSIDVKTGYEKSRAHWSAPTLAQRIIYVCNDFDEIIKIDANSGKYIGKIDSAGPSTTAPIIVDSKMYVVTSNGKLLSLD